MVTSITERVVLHVIESGAPEKEKTDLIESSEDQIALSRWEDDGGAMPLPKAES